MSLVRKQSRRRREEEDSSLAVSSESSDRPRPKKKKKKKKPVLRLRPAQGGWQVASNDEEDSSEISRTEINRIYEEAYMRQKGSPPPPIESYKHSK